MEKIKKGRPWLRVKQLRLMKTEKEIKTNLDRALMDMAKVENQMYHWKRFPKKVLEKIRNDYHWLRGAIEILEWTLREEKSVAN